MPEMSFETKTYSDKSSLTEGWHPAYLLAITDEATPETWKMFAASPRMWRWHFAVWERPDHVASHPPEHQSAPSSQKFTPKGNQPASKAYSWTTALLQRQIPPGERVNLDPMMPFPCRVKVTRNNDYANIIDLELWTEGAALLTPALRSALATVLEGDAGYPAPSTPPASPAARSFSSLAPNAPRF